MILCVYSVLLFFFLDIYPLRVYTKPPTERVACDRDVAVPSVTRWFITFICRTDALNFPASCAGYKIVLLWLYGENIIQILMDLSVFCRRNMTAEHTIMNFSRCS